MKTRLASSGLIVPYEGGETVPVPKDVLRYLLGAGKFVSWLKTVNRETRRKALSEMDDDQRDALLEACSQANEILNTKFMPAMDLSSR